MIIRNNILIDEKTGEILNKNLSPKFDGWTFEDYCKEFDESKEIRFLEAMTAKELTNENIEDGSYLAEEKFDGHRSTCFFTRKGNRFFSRRISKKTNWFAENTDCLPHLRDFITVYSIHGTVIDGELTMPTGIFADVQGVTGALPETAIKNQEEKGCAVLNAFDILYYKGINIQHMPLWKRKLFLYNVIESQVGCENIVFAPVYVDKKTKENLTVLIIDYIKTHPNFSMFPMILVNSYSDLISNIFEHGGEGIMLKKIDGKYEQKRSKNFLKWKDAIYRDVVIMSYEPPTKEFDGKTELDKWEFWEDNKPVTKPYAKGWIGAVTCGVYKEIGNGGDLELVPVVSLKGFTDEELEYIKNNKEKLIGEVLEVKAQLIIDKESGTMRHPRFSRWRPDKSADMCLWEEHIQ